MENGYEIIWTQRAVKDLQKIIEYLFEEWSEKEVAKFLKALDQRLEVINKNPRLFAASEKMGNIRKSVLTRQTTIYYSISDEYKTIQIITLFDTRQDPDKLED